LVVAINRIHRSPCPGARMSEASSRNTWWPVDTDGELINSRP
jgi:hypothetical protein